jgi:FkbM family methyltransferase
MYPPLWARLLRLYGQNFPILRGKSHLAHWLYRKLPKLTRPINTSIARGLQMELWPWQWADFCMYVMNSPEAYHLRYFESRISQRSVVFDIGAYLGIYALTAGRIALEGSVHAFEPDPRSACRLAHAIEVNGLGNVHLRRCAVAERKRESRLALQGYPPQSSLLSPLSHQYLNEAVETIPVSVCTVDQYCQAMNIRHIDLVKIDVEGAELLVLQGGSNTIATSRPELVVELHAKQSQPLGYSVQDTIDHLHMLKYELFHIVPGITKAHLVSFDDKVNANRSRDIIVALPK